MSNTLLRQLSWLLVTLPSLILFDGLSVLAFCLHTDSHSRAENHSHKATVHQQTLTDPEFVNVCCEVMLNFYFIFITSLCTTTHLHLCQRGYSHRYTRRLPEGIPIWCPEQDESSILQIVFNRHIIASGWASILQIKMKTLKIPKLVEQNCITLSKKNQINIVIRFSVMAGNTLYPTGLCKEIKIVTQ